MTFLPEFYTAFACRAGSCRHSCCRGWEIDVDEDTLDFYRNVPGALGERIRAAVAQDEEGAHFVLQEGDRCPFLQADGLCEIICRLGSDALCDICALHPRFYETVGAHTLCGLGLSCEAACNLLLRQETPLRFLCDETGERLSLSALLERLGREVAEDSLRFDGRPCSQGYLDRLARTEPIDDRWPEELAAVCSVMLSLKELPRGARYDRILQYVLYRQLERLEDVPLERLTDYARNTAAWIAAQDLLYGHSDEWLRRWSEQIEYSTENVEILLE